MQKLTKKRGFTLVEIMIVVAILGLLIAIGIPGFLTARNKGRFRSEGANLKAISDNVASYGVNEPRELDLIIRLWPAAATLTDASSYIRKQLTCPATRTAYLVTGNLGSCSSHGSESTLTEASMA